MDSESIIIAISSPPGRAARGLIRASGPGVFDLVEHLRATPHASVRTRGVHRVRIRVSAFELPVLLLSFPGPRSYTGEDTIEVLTVGNPALLERVIEAFIEVGRARAHLVRRAEPGEFTARAFFNQRLSLTEAEGVAATIAAQSDAQLRAAGQLRSGSLGAIAHELADELASVLALVEAGIDFTDQDDVVAIAPAPLLTRLLAIRQRIEAILKRSVGYESLDAIPRVVLVGPPNAGKSTLFNALLGRERAVVSNVAGTTRDVLVEALHVPTDHGDAEVMLIDIAGLTSAGDESFLLNPLMQRAAREAIDRADLLVECAPPDADPSFAFPRTVAPALRVMTKQDVNGTFGRSTMLADPIAVSAHTGEGLAALRREIGERLSGSAVSLAADTLALQPRHDAALNAAMGHLSESITLIEPHRHDRSILRPEIVASVLRLALDDLAELAGDITPDDVLGRVFASFCIGK